MQDSKDMKPGLSSTGQPLADTDLCDVSGGSQVCANNHPCIKHDTCQCYDETSTNCTATANGYLQGCYFI